MKLEIATARVCVVTALALLISSCSPGFSIRPFGSGQNIQLKFFDPGILWSSPKEACISSLRVDEEKWPTRATGHIVWEIEARNKCIKLKEVTVGVLPNGFTEIVKYQPLQIGRMYGATADAEPFRGGSMAWFVCNGPVDMASWKNEYRLNDRPQGCLE
jgi:hypothetical protein